jgi:adenylate kinase
MKVIYVTGAPAAGKSSTLARLAEADPSILHFKYGAELAMYIQSEGRPVADQQELRARSAKIVTPADVEAVDAKLLRMVGHYRGSQTILIDSHAVTKEDYGFRVTAFSQAVVQQLSPDEIWLFYTDPEVAVGRIRGDARGRPAITEEQARMHTHIQASVAITYGVAIGVAVYLIDTHGSQDDLVERLQRRLKNDG